MLVKQWQNSTKRLNEMFMAPHLMASGYFAVHNNGNGKESQHVNKLVPTMIRNRTTQIKYFSRTIYREPIKIFCVKRARMKAAQERASEREREGEGKKGENMVRSENQVLIIHIKMLHMRTSIVWCAMVMDIHANVLRH